MQQIDASEFWLKLGGVIATVLLFLVYLLIRHLTSGKRFLVGPQLSETKMLEGGQFTLKDLQEGTWQVNANKVITFSSFSLGTLILATIFIFEQRLSGYDAYMFYSVLIVFAISIMSYFISLQFWFLALDKGGSNFLRVSYRRRATGLQSVGWMTIVVAILLAVMTVNTVIGYVFCFIALLALVIFFEYKYGILLADEFQQVAPNEFQQGIEVSHIYTKNDAAQPRQAQGIETLRILNWNIERGFEPDALLAYIKQVGADIVCLQEVDWGNLRTDNRDVLEYLAEHTGMLGLYSTEFIEIQTPYRWKKLAGGGVHGNAILTRIKPSSYYRLELPATSFDWNNPTSIQSKLTKYEKRIGARFAMCAEFQLSDKKLLVSSAHFEDKFVGADGRYKQFHSLVEQIKTRMSAEDISVIAGDLNTLETWLTRAVGYGKSAKGAPIPWYVSECAWWQHVVLPPTGYADPWQCKDWTHNVSWFYHQKLDWILVKNCQVENFGRGDKNSSDHRPLWVDLAIRR